MKKRTRNILIIVAVIVIALAVIAYLGFQIMSGPMYEAGKFKAGSITLHEQEGDSAFWNMEHDVRLHHFSVGEGMNVLVVHGGPGMPFLSSAPGFDSLAHKYKFHFYDQRGCGKSSRPIDTFTSSNYYQNLIQLEKRLGLGAQITDIERIRRILGDEKLILIGHSFGGLIASLYAAEFPEKVKALVLISPATMLKFPNSEGNLFEAMDKLLPEEMKAEADAHLKKYLDFSGDIWKQSEADRQKLNTQGAKYYMAAYEAAGNTVGELDDAFNESYGGWMTHAMYFSMGRKHDYRKAFEGIHIPTLILAGDRDITPSTAFKNYEQAFEGAEFRLIKECGHFPFNEQPETFAEIVGEFLGEVLE